MSTPNEPRTPERDELLVDLDPETTSLLTAFGFEGIPFAALAARLAKASFDPSMNHIRETLRPPGAGSYMLLPAPDTPPRTRLAETGRAALQAGQVAVAVLNGGMATRFGRPCKGTAEVLQGHSFLRLKLAQVRLAGEGRAPVLLMNSFATDVATREHLQELDLGGLDVRCFTQFVSLRLTAAGRLFRDSAGRPSAHSPGHGDFPYALARSGLLSELRAQGVRYLTLSNVDNLAAGLDPAVLGAHILTGRPITVELVRKRPGDAGGVPARFGGRVAVAEGFRLPPDFDPGSVPTFSTNTYVFDLRALEDPGTLDFFAVSKQVEGQPVVQFERLVNQLTETTDTTWLVVGREGSDCRFLPIKRPEDLEAQAAELRAVLKQQGVLPS